MKKSKSALLGLLALFLTSWVGIVLASYVQVGRLLPDVDDITHDQTPAAFSGWAEQGRAVYAANGCVYCHSQQVRSRADSADIDREWGARRTVARDYLQDRAAYLGDSRMGPDLSNVGLRRDKADWLYQHMYEPAKPSRRARTARRCVFSSTNTTIAGQPSTEAIKVEGPLMPPVGFGGHARPRRQGAGRLPALAQAQLLQVARSTRRGRRRRNLSFRAPMKPDDKLTNDSPIAPPDHLESPHEQPIRRHRPARHARRGRRRVQRVPDAGRAPRPAAATRRP